MRRIDSDILLVLAASNVASGHIVTDRIMHDDEIRIISANAVKVAEAIYNLVEEHEDTDS